MKNVFKYMMVAVAGMAVLSACEQLEDFQTTVDAPDVLVYSQQAGASNVHTTKVAHAPVGSFGSYEAVFPVTCNSGDHKAATVKVIYDADAAQAYKDEKKLAHTILPAEFISVEKYVAGSEVAASSEAVLSLPEDARVTTDSVRVSLTGDLSKLTEKSYIAALTISSDAFSGSEVLGTYYLEVLTEKNCIRPLEDMDQLAGKQPDRSGWEYIEGLSGDVTSRKSLPGEPLTVVVDMKQTYIVTGVRFGLYSSWGGAPVYSSIEYSVDGSSWEQAGSPDGNQLEADNAVIVAFYGYVEARYIRFTADASNVYSYYRYLNDFGIYSAASKDPTLYFDCGHANVFTGKVKHSPVSSSTDVDYSFPVRVAPAGTSTLTGTVAVDNSLIAAYNEAKGTAFEALPAANLKLEYASVSIPGGSVKSEDVHVALTGDLSALRASAGYLIPLKLSSSAAVDPENSVVYVVVEVMEQLIKSNPTADDLGGLALVSDRSGWSAVDGDGYPVDDIFGQSSWSGSESDPIIVDLGAEYEIGAIALGSVYGNYGDYYRVNGATLAYSLDGASFTGVGVAAASDFVWQSPYQVAVLEVTVKARYIRVSDITATYYYGLNNFNVYVK